MRRPARSGGITAAVLAAITLAGCFDRDAPARNPRDTPGPDADLATRLHAADPANGAVLFGQCAACHSINRASVDLDGPNLYAVVGSRIGERRPRYAYTAALRRQGGTWTFDRLDAWLTAPARFAPGTKMTFGGLANAQDRADIIAFLNQHGSNLPLP